MVRKLFALVMTSWALVLAEPQGSLRLRVAAVQLRSSFDIARNCTRICDHLKQLAQQGVQVAVFPECALTGYEKETTVAAPVSEIERAEKQIEDTCRQLHIAAVVGSIYKVNGRAFDAALAIDSKGAVIERYGKLYLAGEKWATPGNHIAFFDLEGVPSTVIICHDERYPELVRLPALAGARIVYYVSSESPLMEEQKLSPYRAQVMARAVENNVFVVQANAPANPDSTGSHGQSRIVMPDGNVLREASFFGEDTLIETLDIQAGTLQRPLNGLLGPWWKQGVETMLAERSRKLE